jgi:hypothetical protein
MPSTNAKVVNIVGGSSHDEGERKMRFGQKVVCVDASTRVVGAAPPGRYLRPGEIDTVFGLRPCQCGMQLIDVGFSPEGGSIACVCGNHWEDSRY